MNPQPGKQSIQKVTGYLHPSYARSLAEFGCPRQLPRSGGWVLEQNIPKFPYKDARGCYPLFTCQRWEELLIDLEEVVLDWVALSVVTDPFGAYDQTYLQKCFPDLAIPFKEHCVVDLSKPLHSFISYHHRRYASKAFRKVSVVQCHDPSIILDDWVKLYADLMERHTIRGIARFSRESFAQQLKVPGIVSFRAIYEAQTIGILLWFVQGNIGYYHLGAYSSLGYEMRASFALFWTAIEYFAKQNLEWLSLGAGAGIRQTAVDGLRRFKQGWATGTKTAYFCGRIFDRGKYYSMHKIAVGRPEEYFPAYRFGEHA